MSRMLLAAFVLTVFGLLKIAPTSAKPPDQAEPPPGQFLPAPVFPLDPPEKGGLGIRIQLVHGQQLLWSLDLGDNAKGWFLTVDLAPSRPMPSTKSGKTAEAQHLFQIAERCKEKGDQAMAINCFEEVTRLVPGSALAQAARDRLRELDQGEAGEESSKPRPARFPAESRKQSGCPYLNSPPARQRPLPAVVTPESLLGKAAQVRRQEEARRLFDQAQELKKAGQVKDAYRAFHQVHLLAPESVEGQLAMERIHAMESVGAENGEEADAIGPRSDGSRTKEIYDGTQPLELIVDEFIDFEEGN